jgi:uncharacterized protein (TIGR03437 family)
MRMMFGAAACLLLASLAVAQPIVEWVYTETVVTEEDEPENRVVQGSVFTVGAVRLVSGKQSASGFPLPTSLGGRSIRVMAGGGTYNAILLSTDSFSVRAVLPSKTPSGDAVLILTDNGIESAPFKIRVVKRDFGLYDSVQNYDQAGGVQPNTLEHPARAGQLVGLWGTGLGPVDGDETSGPLPSALTIPGLEVLVGGVAAKVVYAGRSGCCAGVDQIIFEAPAGVEGCNVAVKVRYPDGDSADAPKTDFGPVSIVLLGAAADCSQFARPLRYGRIDLSSSVPYVGGGAYASFYTGGPDVLPTMGTCGANLPGTRLSYLDAGPAIHLITPGGPVTLVHPGGLPIPSRDYSSPSIKNLPPGSYAVENGEGGADLKAFRTAFSLPETGFSWTNQDSLTVRPDEGLRVTWNGGVAGGYVVILGRFSIGAVQGSDSQGHFSCVEHVEKESFFVRPADMWTSLTRAADQLELTVIHVYNQDIDVPGLDLAEFIYNLGAYKVVKLH